MLGQRDLNKLYYGDNLEVMREHIPAGSVDLVYLDPPFNSNRNYNVIFGRHSRNDSGAAAQIQAFDDTWRWTPVTDQQYLQYVAGALSGKVANALTAFRLLLGENDALAYLVNMAPRLVELRRVLKPTGSLYLHCDPTMSHYLKVMLDAIFGAERFRGEITWMRTTTHNDAKRWSPNADILLYYGRNSQVTWNPAYASHDEAYVKDKYRFTDSDGRSYRLDNMTSPNPRPNLTYTWKGHEPPRNGWRYSRDTMEQLDREGLIWYPDSKGKRPQLKRYLDKQPGVAIGNVWTDISPINSRAAERLGYPTQKPLGLLERIISASSSEGDVVLDPFCGCGTTIDAAQRLGRRWIGIDITFIAVDLIEKRLRHAHGAGITKTYEALGIPRDMGGAQALFRRSPFDFERFAVSMINAQPNEKQVGDKGIDGVARFYLERNTFGLLLVSVKGGKTVTPQFVRDLIGTVETQKAQMGVLITMAEPSPGVLDAVNHGGTYSWPLNNQTYPRFQVITIRELLSGIRPQMPPPLLPYIQATRATAKSAQLAFDDLAAKNI